MPLDPRFPGIGIGPQRSYPTDKPLRGTFTRKGVIATRVTAGYYLIDFNDPLGPTEHAFYSGPDLLPRGSVIICSRMNESAIWQITTIVVLGTS